MPKGPQGQKRPGDVIGAAILVGRIATGEIAESPVSSPKAAAGKLGGLKGGKARAKALSKAELSKQGKKAAASRWRKREL